jgi:Rrf2 family nitric oxide-sensitive transcriptional repressor
MKLTLKTDYSLRVLIYLQNKLPHKERSTIKEIADFYQIKKNHLNVVVNKLSELGLIHSITGPKGGISISTKAINSNLADIIVEFEDMNLVECFDEKKNTCRLSPGCKLKSILSSAQKSFIKELRHYKISDLS